MAGCARGRQRWGKSRGATPCAVYVLFAMDRPGCRVHGAIGRRVACASKTRIGATLRAKASPGRGGGRRRSNAASGVRRDADVLARAARPRLEWRGRGGDAVRVRIAHGRRHGRRRWRRQRAPPRVPQPTQRTWSKAFRQPRRAARPAAGRGGTPGAERRLRDRPGAAGAGLTHAQGRGTSAGRAGTAAAAGTAPGRRHWPAPSPPWTARPHAPASQRHPRPNPALQPGP